MAMIEPPTFVEMFSKWGNPPFCAKINKKYPIFRGGDLDSFFFLFFDNMSSFLGILAAFIDISKIVTGCWGSYCYDGVFMETSTVNYTNYDYLSAWEDMVFSKVCPGMGVALVVGNVWYAWMAFKLAGYEDRTDVTALPYGINTSAGFLAAFSIMLPLGFANLGNTPTDWARNVWISTCSTCFITGLFEVIGMFIVPFLPRYCSRAALYTPLACVGFVWLGFVPFIAVMKEPIIGAIPLAICFIGFFANKKKGIGFLGIPFTEKFQFVFIVAFGTIFMWAGLGKHNPSVADMSATLSDRAAKYLGKNNMGAFVTLGGLGDSSAFLALLFPIALASFFGTMQNVEMSAAVGGDRYNLKEAMLADGVGSCVGAIFGSPVPTTVYIGYTRHKALNAGCGYSLLNATAFFILTFSGLLPVLYSIVDPVSVGISLVAVGLLILQDTIEQSASRHVPAICIGLFFVVADPWHFDMRAIDTSYCTRTTGRMLGLKNMWPGGGIMCSFIVTQIICDMIDAKFIKGGIFCLGAMVFSMFGLMHGNNVIRPSGDTMIAGTTAGEGELTFATIDAGGLNEGWRFCVAYAILAVYMFGHAAVQKIKPDWIPAPTPGNGFADDAMDFTLKDAAKTEAA